MKAKIIMSVAFALFLGGCEPMPYRQPLPGEPFQVASHVTTYRTYDNTTHFPHTGTPKSQVEIVNGVVVHNSMHEVMMQNRLNNELRYLEKKAQAKKQLAKESKLQGKPFLHQRVSESDDYIIIKR